MKKPENYLSYNREAWNHQVRSGNRWTVPFSDEVIEAAKKGVMNLVLTPQRIIPENWYAPKGSKVLGLASGGGQQGPVLAAAGYDVTIFDNSSGQLLKDQQMSDKFQLGIKTVEGDMADLSVFENETFDMVFNPCSTGFVSDVIKVYAEAARVLKKGGIFMTGFTKPVYYLFDIKLAEKGIFTLKYESPYSDLESLDEPELNFFLEQNEPVVFGHSLEAHFNGQLKAGLQITEIMEDTWGDNNPVDRHFPCFMATRAVKSF
ncbi:MAG: class I SAM-dependent methyltransferase [Bacteroidota bacterium]|nr:class I SAM-dependent methyltransferase [Bacteroidota bacterium]